MFFICILYYCIWSLATVHIKQAAPFLGYLPFSFCRPAHECNVGGADISNSTFILRKLYLLSHLEGHDAGNRYARTYKELFFFFVCWVLTYMHSSVLSVSSLHFYSISCFVFSYSYLVHGHLRRINFLCVHICVSISYFSRSVLLWMSVAKWNESFCVCPGTH